MIASTQAPFTGSFAKLGQVATGTRRCEGCGLNKSIAEFTPHAGSTTGLHKKCDDCRGQQLAYSGAQRSKTFALKREARDRVAARSEHLDLLDQFTHVQRRLASQSLTHLDHEVAVLSRELETLITQLRASAAES